ncbi:helix-turn-helix transcriptional regulator [Curtobacterium sp. MCPF17_002]|uniref:helix-turn-helix transcriptional regulator n=1 Tax=Curtobacterium sp. MCPF17_002 TaxID=2175645 RepID=UPI000DA80553|nr:helix-turn-helix transcriptional regulator [Curtobacterium sp. MCPF17_002]WIB76961.1 helix-turn-helix transcriptional regulator [Curtobacterium sp. MCPF17_002]
MSPERDGPHRLPRAVRDAVQILRERARTRVSLTDVATAVGLSPRSLQKAFRSEFGQTPGEYLRGIRLDGVRRELQDMAAAPDRERIADIARRWQFSNAGRMAAAYRVAYGAAPSDAVRFFEPDTAAADRVARRRFRLVLDCEIDVDDLEAAIDSARRRAEGTSWQGYRPDGGAESVVAFVLGNAIRAAAGQTDGVQLLAVDPMVRVPDALGGYERAELPPWGPSPPARPVGAPGVGSDVSREGAHD